MPKIILLSKDTLRQDDLPVYGNRFWSTPNLDAIADQGTVFHRHYACASSTAMSVTAMFTGLFPHELSRDKFNEISQFNGTTLFDKLHDLGYGTHVVWPRAFIDLAWKYSKIFPPTTQIHNLSDISGFNPCQNETTKPDHLLVKVQETVEEILRASDTVFIWLHLPNVMAPRNCFGGDIDLLDEVLGVIRRYFGDNEIYITSDHGYLKMEKGITSYAFHLYEGLVRVPLITPRLNQTKDIDFPTSHAQLMDMILTSKIVFRPYLYSDTQYYKQVNRKFAVIHQNYKYIFNKIDKSEEFYDLAWDPEENRNLLLQAIYDRNRRQKRLVNKLYHYPYEERALTVYERMKAEKNRIWRQGSWLEENLSKMFFLLKNFISEMLFQCQFGMEIMSGKARSKKT